MLYHLNTKELRTAILYAGLFRLWPALPSDFKAPLESPSEEASMDLVKEVERSA